jgi:molybdopterin/thiamine biosynthesis adenylyltransferase
MTIDRFPPLSSRERERYARHLTLPDIGEAGQRRLKGSRVMIVGLGGLGSPVALYLAAAGVGSLGLVDADVVTFSNLQRQVIHTESELGTPKVQSAERRIRDLNPDVRVETFAERFDPETGLRFARGYDLIVDGTDNFESRYAVNDVCLRLGIPYVYGAIFRLEGQVSVLCTQDGPCYRCLFPVPPPPEGVLTGEEAGILGAVPGTIGTIEATEAIKWLVGFGDPLVGRLLAYDAYGMRFDVIETRRDPACPACGRGAR